MAKILLVEDDINLREIYAARLTAESYQVAAASDGEEALAKAVREKPDLILLDIMMPKISGFDVLDILRSTPETRETKVVMLTALSQSTDRQRGEQLGVDKYLVKSQITLEDVVQTIGELLGHGPTAEQIAKQKKAQKDKEQSQTVNQVDQAVKNLQQQKEPPKVQVDKRPRLKKDSQSPDQSKK